MFQQFPSGHLHKRNEDEMNLFMKGKQADRESTLTIAGEGGAEGWRGSWGLADVSIRHV